MLTILPRKYQFNIVINSDLIMETVTLHIMRRIYRHPRRKFQHRELLALLN